jgi:hypothetical protein
MFPEIVLPFVAIELETAVPMYAGTESTGELLPGEIVQLPPQGVSGLLVHSSHGSGSRPALAQGR